MGRKRRFSKLLLFAAMLSTIGAGVLGSVPLPVRAAEEKETYTVTFEAFEGTCETESVSVPKGESIILPDASCEGHYLYGWVDVVEEEGITVLYEIGVAGSEYTPEKDVCLQAHWKPNEGQEPEQDITVTYEARIGDTGYEELEEAFANAQAGDTITVLKDCCVSRTLEAAADNIILQSENADNPATISREEEFTGKDFYRTDLDNVLLGVEGSLIMRDIILDGGAELDGDFNNTGQTWDSPLVYVAGACTVKEGTVFQNNYNTDHNDDNLSFRTAGAIHVAWGGEFAMTGGLIQHCYTNGAGGGIQAAKTSCVTITSGAVRECYAAVGGAMDFFGLTSVSGMTISDNKAWAAIVAVRGETTLSGCLIENNEVTGDAGTVSISENSPVVMEGCTITGNHNKYTSAISYSGKDRTELLTIRDCTIRGNIADDLYSGVTIDYMTKADLILDGKIVMEENTVAGGKAWDIRFYYQDATPVTLGADFESDSEFVMWGYDFAPGTLLVDATSNGKEADASQFLWKTQNYRTEKRDGNIYLAEIPKTYCVSYDANNSPTGSSVMCSDPNLYTSEDTVTIMDREALFPLMGNIVKFGYDFTGWNTEPDGTGTDYAPGQETSLTGNLYLYAKWEEKEPVTLTYIYNDEEGRTDSAQVIPGANTAFPNASRKGYRLKGWYEDEELTVFAGSAGEKYYAPQEDASYYAAWEKTEATAVTCTITFDPDGGETVRKSITAEKDSKIILPICNKSGYGFLGWFLASDDSICAGQAGEEFTVQGDMTLKAHFEKKEAVKVTITFDTDGGKEAKPIKAAKGDSIRLPKTEKDGYNFLGWYTEKEGGILLGIPGSEMKAVKDMTAYALWEKEAVEDSDNDADPETCKVTFHAGKGTIKTKELAIIKGGSLHLPMPEREGHDFTGWYLDDALTQFAGAYHDTYRITKDTSFYAKGYIFKGWYTDRQVFIGTEGETYKPGRSISLYVRWEKADHQDSITGNTNDKDNKNNSDKNGNTGGTVSGNSAGSPSDKNIETKTEGGNENAGKGTEPVIQTGHASPFILLAALGLCGVVLAAASLLEGKKICP
ncbi:InlB B-repeat-containing protein [Lachnospiraceae bacterium 64-25]